MAKLPHATSDNRFKKAINIESFLTLQSTKKTYKLLEIGTGTGLIASYFANHSTYNFEVHSVDVVDQCIDKTDINFQIIQNTLLPYGNNEFDIIISNHVIEHVGNNDIQTSHLQEIYRVLNTNGEVYLACPNKFMLKEPHYQLYFLSWLPRNLANQYIKLMKMNNQYDCYPPHLVQLDNLIKAENFNIRHVEAEIINNLLNQNNNVFFQKSIYLACQIFKFWIPTFVCILRKK